MGKRLKEAFLDCSDVAVVDVEVLGFCSFVAKCLVRVVVCLNGLAQVWMLVMYAA